MDKKILREVKFHNEKLSNCIFEFNKIKNIKLKSYIKRCRQLKVMIKRHRKILIDLRVNLINK